MYESTEVGCCQGMINPFNPSFISYANLYLHLYIYTDEIFLSYTTVATSSFMIQSSLTKIRFFQSHLKNFKPPTLDRINSGVEPDRSAALSATTVSPIDVTVIKFLESNL